jgi:hypothetical protein
MAIRFKMFVGDAEPVAGDFGNTLHLALLGNFDIR